MFIKTIITDIENTLIHTFNNVDKWFDKPETTRQYRPQNGGWTIDEILEHIELTSHFLLKLIDKGTIKALKNKDTINLDAELANYSFQKDAIDTIGIHKSFAWIRPEHMEPKGEKTPETVRKDMKIQLDRCLNYLHKLPNGEGILCKTTMTVNGLGKIDVYEYIYFLAKHAERHITQMEKNETEYVKMSNFSN
jgi:DinB superfamily